MTTSPAAVECHILDTGYCLASEHHLIQGGRRQTLACHSLVALLYHPREGWMLWDTGYSPRMLAAARGWPFGLYQQATPLFLSPDLAVVNQIARFGLKPEDIRTIIISHFHADHIAGLLDFPQARFVAAASAWDDTSQRRGINALRRAIIPALLPADFESRANLITHFEDQNLPGLGAAHNLLGDESLLLIALPGHARGQIGLLARTTQGEILFAADGAWTSQSIREKRPPGHIANLIVDDPKQVRQTIFALHAFASACPQARLIPTHCPEAFEREVK